MLNTQLWNVDIYCLESGLLGGQENMDLDVFLLHKVCQSQNPILIVRTYGWREPTISLGIHQSADDVAAVCSTNANSSSFSSSLPVVKRPTGGRAILHGEDYS